MKKLIFFSLLFVASSLHAFMFLPDPDECIPTSSVATVCLDGAIWSPCFERGDVNKDGEVNVGDIVVLQRFIFGLSCEGGGWFGDMNSDGMFNVADLLLLQRKVLGE